MIKFYNGHKMPKLGLGTFLMQDDNQTKEVIKKALEIGYRHFDTAQGYFNEIPIGEALKEAGVNRKDIYLTTKLRHHHSKEVTKELIINSLKSLKTDYLDLLLIHWPNHDDEVNLNTWQVFEELYEEGLVKAIGVSNFTRYQLDKLIAKAKFIPMVNQVEMHPLLSQVPMIDYLNKHKIVLTSYGPLMRGQIFNEPYFEIFDKIAKNHECTIAQVVIAWGLAKGVMMIPKTVNFDRLVENFESTKVKLTTEEIATIDQINIGKRLYSDPANNVYGLLKE